MVSPFSKKTPCAKLADTSPVCARAGVDNMSSTIVSHFFTL